MIALKEFGMLPKLSNIVRIMPQIIIGSKQCRSFHRNFMPRQREIRRRQKRLPPPKPYHRNTLLEWNYNSELYSFQKRLGEDFDDKLLRVALTERSYIVKQEEEMKNIGISAPVVNLQDNRDLSSKGEILMRSYISQYLRHVLPRFPEEGIISLANYLMSEDVLSHVSFHLGTSELILCVDFPTEKATLASVLKALVFAISQSSGIDRATLFVRDFIITQLAEQDINELWHIEDPIQLVNNICRNEGQGETEPRIIGEAGVNTILACYRIGLYLNKQMIGLGFGESVEIAHEMAARDTLRRIFHTSEHQLSIPYDLVIKPNLENEAPSNVSIKDWTSVNVEKQIARSKQLNV